MITDDHKAAQKRVVDTSENIHLKVKHDFAIQNEGVNLPLEFLDPIKTKNDAIVKMLARNLLWPKYDLISAFVKEHGDLIEIPDVIVIRNEDVQMKGGRKCQVA